MDEAARDIFERIRAENGWKGSESISGPGSSRGVTAQLRPQLLGLLQALRINAFADAPCGDFNWIGPVARRLKRYVGIDIVAAVIESARARAAEQNIAQAQFLVADLTTDELPACDLYMVRDCLVHLTYAQAKAAMQRVAASGASWLLTSTFPDHGANTDIVTGQWRPLNLERPPFSLPPPRALLVERPDADPHPAWGRKCLGLWRTSDLS